MVEDLSRPGRGNKVGGAICGTAFVADERGYFLTALHAVKGLQPNQIELRTTYGRDGGYAMLPCRSVEAVYPNSDLDLAVLAVPSTFTQGRTAVKIDPTDLGLGDEILLIGYAEGTQLVFADPILGQGSAKSFSPVAFNGMICARVPDDTDA